MENETNNAMVNNTKKLSYVIVCLSLAVGMLFGFGA